MKDLQKEILGGVSTAYVYTTLLFQSCKINVNVSEAKKILQKKRECPNGEIYACNNIKIEYDIHIILPVYNTEMYLKECIDSILNQNTKYSFLLTIVNDGSTDNSESILSKYLNDSRIEIITQKNKGLSCARNRALELIKGKYIMFVDSDDRLGEGAIEKLLSKAFKWDADVVEGGYESIDVYDNIKNRFIQNSSKSENDYFDSMRGQPWGKVFKAEIFKNLKYPEGFIYEDSILAYCIYPIYRKKYEINQLVYQYRINPKGIVITNRKSYNAIDHYWIMGKLWLWSIKNKIHTEECQKRMLRHMALGYRRTKLLGDDVTKAGFSYLRNIYMNEFDQSKLSGKYRFIDNAVRDNDYGKFSCLSQFGDYIIY